MVDREALIADVIASQERMQQVMAMDRTNPLLHSTLTMQQLKTLLVLSQHADASGQELATAMGVTMATMTGIIDRLVAAGMVERREDPRDRRIRRTRLTAAGQATFGEIVTAGRERTLAVIRSLDDDDLLTVQRALAILADAVTRKEC
jgi:DNA-binding MarR family transcriptional regulator